jgi:hypothetical protein
LKLREITRKAIAVLEEKSGSRVTVVEDATLASLSSIRIARDNLPAHILSYKPGAKGDTPDFTICWQCAFALRMFECPPDQRFLIAANAEGGRLLEEILTAPNGVVQRYHLDDIQLQSFQSQLLHGLITHLRSVPIGLRVSQKLTLDFPELLELETANVDREWALANETLSASIQEMMPAQVFDPTQAIHTAYALFWAERLEKPEIVNPFRVAGFEEQGMHLLHLMDSIPGDPLHDNELIDSWANYLGIRNWYAWLPYQAP